MMDNNHNGKIVLFLYPIPNSLIEPSVLYKKFGFINCMHPKIIKNKIIVIIVLFCLIKFLYISILIYIHFIYKLVFNL